MLVPQLLFGTARDVRASVRKALTRLKRGETLRQICESSGWVDLNAHPQSLVWMDSAWVLRPQSEVDYRAILLTNGIFDSTRIPFEVSNTIREESLDYLASSPWGTALMNSGQAGVWYVTLPLRPFRPSRRAYRAILEATLRHWNDLIALGPRYYSGGDGAKTFPATLPAYGGILANLGIDPKGEGVAWKDIGTLCNPQLLERLGADDEFWNGLLKRWKSEWRTPDLVPENTPEIQLLCEEGSWDEQQWAFLRQELGTTAVDAALEKLAARGDSSKLLGVFVHALHDMDRATALFNEQEGNSDLFWATSLIAEHVKQKHPERAAMLIMQAADRAVGRGERKGYGPVVTLLEEARDVLGSASLDSLWKTQLADFAAAHGRRRALMSVIAKRFG